jgi:glycosyltransferase involved in cell wall biosynthesis
MSRDSGKLKILIYGEYFPPVVGGVQTAMNLLAKGLVDLNSRQGENDDPREIEVTVATRTAADGMDDSAFPYRIVRRPRFRQLAKLIRDADVIHLAGPCLLPMAIGWLIGKPVVVEHHGYQAICPNGLLFQQPAETVCSGHFIRRDYSECLRCCSATEGRARGFGSFLLTFPRYWLSRRVAAHIAITNHVSARLNLPRTETVYYGIEVQDSMSAGEAPPPPGCLEIAYVGRLVPEKGLPVLLQATKRLRDSGVFCEVKLIGDGPERGNLEKLAETLGLNGVVQFTGDLRNLDLERAVNKVGVVVMPSVWEETAGLSAIEQMMRGRVVIVADIGGLSEVVGEAGLKFAPCDSQALAACIRKVIENPTLAVSLGSMARERAIRLFKLSSMIEGHIAIYREVWPGEMQENAPDSVERHTEV